MKNLIVSVVALTASTIGVGSKVTDRLMHGPDYTIWHVNDGFNPDPDYDGDVETPSVGIGMRL